MRTNYLADSAVKRYGNRHKPLAERTAAYGSGNIIRTGIDDFLRNNPLATLNRYGERVIAGSRIC
jgi:hypothetical protein